MNVVVFGRRSNLSLALAKRIKSVTLFSTIDIFDEAKLSKLFELKDIFIIMNQFQPACQLDNINNPQEYINNSIMATAKILSFCQNQSRNIRKIIYTSSSSVYGNNSSCRETDTLRPESLHAALKISNERLVASFARKEKIPFVVTRIFNMFGGYDEFSIISKIIFAIKQKNELTLINHGAAIRDFIHIDDVASIYEEIIQVDYSGYLNIGTGSGNSVKNILSFVDKYGFHLKLHNINKLEIRTSIAENTTLKGLCKFDKFKTVEEFLLEELSNE